MNDVGASTVEADAEMIDGDAEMAAAGASVIEAGASAKNGCAATVAAGAGKIAADAGTGFTARAMDALWRGLQFHFFNPAIAAFISSRCLSGLPESVTWTIFPSRPMRKLTRLAMFSTGIFTS